MDSLHKKHHHPSNFLGFPKEGELVQAKLGCNWKQNSFMITFFLRPFSPIQILLLQGEVSCKYLYYVYLITNFCKRKINSVTCGDAACQE